MILRLRQVVTDTFAFTDLHVATAALQDVRPRWAYDARRHFWTELSARVYSPACQPRLPIGGTVRTSMTILAALALAACAKGDDTAAADSGAAAEPAAGAPAANSDPDRATGGSGVPSGFMARLDSTATGPRGNIAEAKYTKSGDMWEVVTGPHHIVWEAADSASGNYTATARLQQMEAPAHREAYGIFVGGGNLDQPSHRYLYFVVGGTGEYMISRRDSTKVTALKPWTASDAVPKADASGKVDYTLAVRVAGDSVRFMVNNTQVPRCRRRDCRPMASPESVSATTCT